MSLGRRQAGSAPEPLWRLLAASAWAGLSYERSRAPSIWHAIRAWMKAARSRAGRAVRVGPSQYLNMLQVERDAWRAGLAYPAEDEGQRVPWQLPERFARIDVSQLPAHPLIEPQHLKNLLTQGLAQGAAPVEALSALRALMSKDGLPARWEGVPLGASSHALNSGGSRLAVCLHLFYPDLWDEFFAALSALPEPWDLFVTLPDFACTSRLARIVADKPMVRFFPRPNRGRDVAPWLHLMGEGVFDQYELVLKLHTKKSPHTQAGDDWRRRSHTALIGSSDQASALIAAVRAAPSVGLVGPSELLVRAGDLAWGNKSRSEIGTLARASGLSPTILQSTFFAGTMFWFRPPALQRLRSLRLTEVDFAVEMGQTDGTLAHAIERTTTGLLESEGYAVGSWDQRSRELSILRPLSPSSSRP